MFIGFCHQVNFCEAALCSFVLIATANQCCDQQTNKILQAVVETGTVKFSHTGYQALGPELILVYRQSAHR